MKNKFLIFVATFFIGLTIGFAQKENIKKSTVINAIEKNSSLSASFKKTAISRYRSANKWIEVLGRDSIFSFERAIASGQGKDFLPKQLVASAKKKFPGNSEAALRERFKIYIKQMERVHEDE